MARARITIQHTLEYEINPDNYPDCNSDLERLTLDINNYSRPDVAVEAILMGNSAIAVTGELVKEAA
jgi:hypothetical protein